MKINPDELQIFEVTLDHIEDWSRVFLKGMTSFRWMSRYLKDQEITKLDVSISLREDLQNKTESDLFLIAYLEKVPVGVIRFEDYWLSKTTKILSHFPLVLPKYQRKGIGQYLVAKGIDLTKKRGYTDVWTECWSKDRREIAIYRSFYENIGFEAQSNRYEMSCNLNRFNFQFELEIPEMKLDTSEELTEDFILALSTSYAQSNDKLHLIENLGDKEICKEFLTKTKDIFSKLGFRVKFTTARFNDKICASLMTAYTKQKGMILEIGVVPEFRKRNIAKKLIYDFITKMKQDDASDVVLGVDQENFPAVELYKKLGFVVSWQGLILLHKENMK